MKAKPHPYPAKSQDAQTSVSKNDNIGRFTTPNPNSVNMGITNIVRANKERKRAEKVDIVREAVIQADMCKVIMKK